MYSFTEDNKRNELCDNISYSKEFLSPGVPDDGKRKGDFKHSNLPSEIMEKVTIQRRYCSK